VLGGLPAWAEDRIETLTLGEVSLRLVKPCTRCTIPSIDQRTGRPGTDPTPALREFRFDKRLHGVCFGENAVIVSGVARDIERGATCRVDFEPSSTAAS
jgi:MOSC domain-containing protein